MTRVRAWRETQAPRLRGRVELVRLMWAAGPALTVVIVVLLLVNALTAAAGPVVIGLVIGAIPGALRGGLDSTAGGNLVAALFGLGAVRLVSAALQPLIQQLPRSLGDKAEALQRRRLMRAAMGQAGIAHLEQPEALDRMMIASGIGMAVQFTPLHAVDGLVGVWTQRLQGLAAAIVLARFSVLASVALAATWLLFVAGARKDIFEVILLLLGGSKGLRRSDYFHSLAVTPAAAKETRVFGLKAWIGESFATSWLATMQVAWRARRGTSRILLWAVPLVALSHVAVLNLLVNAGLRGEVSLGGLTTYLLAALGMGALAYFSEHHLFLEFGTAGLLAGREFETMVNLAEPPVAGRGNPAGMPQKEVRFEDIHFHYPGSQRDIYSGIDLAIPAGKSVAIVGANGAGKTTLVKLLARLYEPSAGRILVDGVDIRELDPELWQRRMAPIFQDFIHYQLGARENVGFGAVERVADSGALQEAVARAGAEDIISSLPTGWDTILSREFEGGTDLSGGQWQRLALARALFAVDAGAGILVLDEPTASLDVRAEAALFDRYLELTRGVTTILISHRFSSVRHADNICVIDAGRIAEQGSHEELMARRGLYRQMFDLQAARFREGPSSDEADAGLLAMSEAGDG